MKQDIKEIMMKVFKENKYLHKDGSDQRAVVYDFIQLVLKEFDSELKDKEEIEVEDLMEFLKDGDVKMKDLLIRVCDTESKKEGWVSLGQIITELGVIVLKAIKEEKERISKLMNKNKKK